MAARRPASWRRACGEDAGADAGVLQALDQSIMGGFELSPEVGAASMRAAS